MSLFQGLSQGSLFSDESLLQSRDGYRPMSDATSDELAFEQWTQRVTHQHELSIARELAGLPEPALAGLASVFARSPRRRRTDRLRHAIPAGAASTLIGALVLWAGTSVGGVAAALLQVVGVGGLAVGVIVASLGVLAAFSTMALEVAHGKLGLCTGLLNEQHPWLYKASLMTRDPAAEAYRRRILSERGPLRGADYLVMREIVRANDAMEMTRIARTVAEQLNRVDAAAPDAAHGKEPRLVSVASANGAFGPGLVERRRPG
ncbi:MAG TPA: hypothetical protein VGE16_16390 [Albitalea sp.]